MAESGKNYGRMPLGEILVDMGCISQQQWEAALSMAGRRGCAFQDVLIEGGLISEEDVSAALALQHDLRMLSWNRIKRIVSLHELHRVHPSDAAPPIEHLVWSRRGGPTLVLVHEPADAAIRNRLKAAYGQRRVQVCLATPATFAEAAAKTRVPTDSAAEPPVDELVGGTAEVEAPPPVETGEFGLPESSDAEGSDPFSSEDESDADEEPETPEADEPDVEAEGGEVVDGYRILRELASGAVGTVHLAERMDDKTRVAIKRLHAHLAANPKAVAQFAAERHLLERFQHPNIITVYGGGTWDGRPYFAMELLPGASLGDAIKRGDVLPVPTIMWLWCQIADALAYAHRMGVLHRDIKPDNVLLDKGPSAKLVDFGIANAMGDGVAGTETAAGTPLYMAPEQLRGQPLCPATDIYALGMLAFQMLTGEILDGHLDMQAMIRRRQQRDISVDDIRRPLAKGLQARGQMTEIDASMMDFTRILHQSLRLQTKDRYRDAEELSKRLRILMRMRGWPTPPSVRLPPAQEIDWDAMPAPGEPTVAAVDVASADAATVELPATAQPEQPRIPEDYEVVKDLGKGSMGEVYLARDRDNGRMVALKLIAPEMAANTRFRNRFQREAEVLGRLSHPAIVHIYGVQFEGPTPHIAMEFVSGQDLDAVLRAKKQLTVEESVGIIAEIADALKHVHAAGIIHRDLKPSNLMVTTNGEIKILDFGVAKDEEGAELTKTGAVIGTPHYMSPEQASGKPATPKSDMYALGMIWYQLLVGRVPFRGSIPQVLHQHVAIQPPRVSDSVPVPDNIDKLIARMLRKRAEDRPESFDEVIRIARSLTAPPPTFIGIWSSLRLALFNIVAGGMCLGAGFYGGAVLPDVIVDWAKLVGVALLGLGGVNVVLHARSRRQGK